jgi:hypothetical protein
VEDGCAILAMFPNIVLEACRSSLHFHDLSTMAEDCPYAACVHFFQLHRPLHFFALLTSVGVPRLTRSHHPTQQPDRRRAKPLEHAQIDALRLRTFFIAVYISEWRCHLLHSRTEVIHGRLVSVVIVLMTPEVATIW